MGLSKVNCSSLLDQGFAAKGLFAWKSSANYKAIAKVVVELVK